MLRELRQRILQPVGLYDSYCECAHDELISCMFLGCGASVTPVQLLLKAMEALEGRSVHFLLLKVSVEVEVAVQGCLLGSFSRRQADVAAPYQRIRTIEVVFHHLRIIEMIRGAPGCAGGWRVCAPLAPKGTEPWISSVLGTQCRSR